MAPDLTPYLTVTEGELRAALDRDEPALLPFYAMLRYPLGFADEQFQPVQADSGKRLRPVFCLLVSELLCGDYARALPGAAAVELLHNFSLVHDDIEDGDEMRRHRATLWTLAGVPHAINAGDALFALAERELLRLPERGVAAERVLRAIEIFQDTCVQLVEGQYLDMQGEQIRAPSLAWYKQMIAGKTAALLSAATGIGAAVATDDAHMVTRCREFGIELGLAYQMTDDILGLWGDPSVTGKAAGADLRRKKKSLPVVLALERDGPLSSTIQQAFDQGTVREEDVLAIMRLMDEANVRTAAEQEVEKHRHRASRALKRIIREGAVSTKAGVLLEALTATLTQREK